MSIFSGAEHALEHKALDNAVKHLGKDGVTGIGSIGHLYYDYDSNKITCDANPKVLSRVRAEWEKNHEQG